MAALSAPVAPRGKGDAIDRVSARPDFAILEFPGPLKTEETVTKDSPPMLLTAANDGHMLLGTACGPACVLSRGWRIS